MFFFLLLLHANHVLLKLSFKNIDLHFIGPLQSNKAKKALEIFNCIHSIDREKLVKKIKQLTSYQHYIYYYGKKNIKDVTPFW